MTTIDKAKTGQQIRLLMEKRGVTVRDVGKTRGNGKRREKRAFTGLRAECLSLAGWPEHAHIGQSLCLKRSAEGADGYAGLRKPAL